jgi:hypothetical protein
MSLKTKGCLLPSIFELTATVGMARGMSGSANAASYFLDDHVAPSGDIAQPSDSGGPVESTVPPTAAAYAALLAAHPNAPSSGPVGYLSRQRARAPYVVDQDQSSSHKAPNYLVTNTTTYDFNDDLKIKNIVGYARASAIDTPDVDGSPYPVIAFKNQTGNPVVNAVHTSQASVELQLLGKTLDHKSNYIIYSYHGYERDIDQQIVTT